MDFSLQIECQKTALRETTPSKTPFPLRFQENTMNTNTQEQQDQNTSAPTPGGAPDTTGPTETEMPDSAAIDARVQSGEGRSDAEAAFGGSAETETSMPPAHEGD